MQERINEVHRGGHCGNSPVSKSSAAEFVRRLTGDDELCLAILRVCHFKRGE